MSPINRRSVEPARPAAAARRGAQSTAQPRRPRASPVPAGAKPPAGQAPAARRPPPAAPRRRRSPHSPRRGRGHPAPRHLPSVPGSGRPPARRRSLAACRAAALPARSGPTRPGERRGRPRRGGSAGIPRGAAPTGRAARKPFAGRCPGGVPHPPRDTEGPTEPQCPVSPRADGELRG